MYVEIPLRSVMSKEIFGPVKSILFLLDVRAVPVMLPNVNFVRRAVFTLPRIERIPCFRQRSCLGFRVQV